MAEKKAYETRPSLTSLQSKPESSLSCVYSFTVSSTDGRIYFPGPIDLRGFSLEDITITPDYIQVYGPGHSPKPGTRLNRPAVITLFQSPAVKSLTKEEARLRVQRFGGQLRMVDPVRGYVEFAVEHFTRYGLDEEESEEEIPPPEPMADAMEDNDSDRFSFSPQPHQGKRAKEEESEGQPYEEFETMEEAAPMSVSTVPISYPELKVAFAPNGRMLVGGAFLLQTPPCNQATLHLLDLHLECTSAVSHPTELPVVQSHTYSQLIKMWTAFVARLFNSGESIPDYEYLVQLWSLVNTLFGDPAVNITEFVSNPVYMQETIQRHEAEDFAINNNDDLVQLKRRRALYYWLKLFCRSSPSPIASPYRKILELVSCASPVEAVNLAMDTKNFNLAALLSQTPRHCFTKLMESQLDHWMRSRVDQFMDPDLKTLYEVLAAQFNSVTGLDWKRLFTLVFIYGTAHNSHISEAYKRFFEECVLRQQTKVASTYRSNVVDACYQLLQLVYDPHLFLRQFDGLLNPYSHSRSLEFGHSWLLSQALSEIYTLELFPIESGSRSPFDVAVSSDITRRFLQELLDSGRWEWAAYVMIVGNFPSIQFSGILTRYIDLFQGSDQEKVNTMHKLEFCRERLHVPVRLLAECRALNAEYNQVYEDAYRYYLQADDPESAYELLIREVGPTCIIRYPEAQRLKKELIGAIMELEGLSRVLPTLRLSVQAYHDYCDLLIDAESLEKGEFVGHRLDELLSRMYEVSMAIKKLPTETILQTAAKSEMAERLGRLYLQYKQLSPSWNFDLGEQMESCLYDGSMHSSAELLQTHMSALLDVRHATS